MAVNIGVSSNASFWTIAIIGIISIAASILVTKLSTRSSIDYIATRGKTVPYLIIAGVWSNWIWLGGLLGAGEGGYLFGLPATWAYPLGWWVSMFLFAPVIKRLRTILKDAVTHTQFMKLRFDSKTQILYSLGTLAIVLASIIVNFCGVGLAYKAIGGISYSLAILLTGAIIILYVVISGIWAVHITSFMQTIFIGFFTLIIVPVVMYKVGGPGVIAQGFVKQGIPQFSNVINSEVILAFLVPMTLSYLFFAQTDPSVWQKGFSVSYSWLWKTLIIGVTAAAVLDATIAMLGVTAKALLPFKIETYFAVPIAIAYWAPGFSVVFLAMCFCAMLSTGASLLNACAAYINIDIIKPYIIKNASNITLILSTRITVIVIGIACTLVSAFLLEGVSLLGLIVVIGLVISAFAFPVTLGMFWEKTNKHVVFYLTILAIVLTVVLWFSGFGGVWGEGLWKIMLINYLITGPGVAFLSLIFPEKFSFERLKGISINI